MQDQVRAIIEETASMRQTICYSELMVQIDLRHSNRGHRSKLAKLLHQTCSGSFEEEGFMLGSIVVSKATGMPSASFFKYARQIGALEHDDEESFFQEQRDKVFEHQIFGKSLKRSDIPSFVSNYQFLRWHYFEYQGWRSMDSHNSENLFFDVSQ